MLKIAFIRLRMSRKEKLFLEGLKKKRNQAIDEGNMPGVDNITDIFMAYYVVDSIYAFVFFFMLSIILFAITVNADVFLWSTILLLIYIFSIPERFKLDLFD